MLMPGSYDSRCEKLDLKEKRKRKVYQELESPYELQDLYRVNE